MDRSQGCWIDLNQYLTVGDVRSFLSQYEDTERLLRRPPPLYCNARKAHTAANIPKRAVSAEWAGEGYCKNLAGQGTRKKKPTTRCKHHGGDRHSFSKDDYRYGLVRHVPSRLMSYVEDALNDERLISMEKDQAVLFARQMLLLEELGDIEPAQWARVQEQWSRIQSLTRQEDIQEAIRMLGAIIEEGHGAAVAIESRYSEFFKLSDLNRKMLDSKSKHLERENQMVPMTQVFAIIMRLVDHVIAIHEKHGVPAEVTHDVGEAYARLVGQGRNQQVQVEGEAHRTGGLVPS